jgi:tetratricopeptide (TPR) repeat protein
MEQKKYQIAANMFSAVLEKYPITRCEKVKTLVDKARALAKGNFKENALKTINAADDLKRGCSSISYPIDQEIGDIYLRLGMFQKAIDIFNQAIAVSKQDTDNISIKLKIAQCYWQINKKDKTLTLYNQISNLNDPFWSNVAKEKMEHIEFNNEIRKTDVEWKSGDNI